MAIDKDYIGSLISEAENNLQEVQNICGRDIVDAAKVGFPRGFIRTASEARSSIPNLGTEVQRRNVSYALMKLDVFRWLAVRTDLYGAPLSMVIKEAISSLGAICEWLTKEATRGHASNRPYAKRTEKLVELGVIDEELKTELDWVWEIRCREHLHEVDDLEHEMYGRKDYNRALRAFRKLKVSLADKHGYAKT